MKTVVVTRWPVALLLPVLLPGVALSADDTTLVVSAAPAAAPSELDTPASLNVVAGETLRQATPQINLSERLGSVPGLQILNRQNYAQDLQLSVRGFGSRATYGVRGVRIYVDNIPATMPDGQGQTSNIDIGSVERVEVLRGPFSALWGNASGGVVNITTERGSQPDRVQASSWYGSHHTWRYGLKASGAAGDGSQPGDVNYLVSTTRFTTHGYRDHSGARKNLANAKLGVRIDDASTLTLLFNTVDLTANDPGGLTDAQWRDNPRQVAGNVLLYNARKTVKQTQAGLHYERQLNSSNDVSLMAWAGERETLQYQSIPRAVQQAGERHPGGIIGLTRHYQGVDARWTQRHTLAGMPVTFTAGLDYETMSERRKGWQNFITDTTLGEKGELRRNERNRMWNLDPYLQTAWQLTDRLALDAGVRFSTVSFNSADHYITALNGDDSGDARYHRWLPVASLKYAVSDAWNLYASAGRGFETPTINELSYRAGERYGLNLDLQPATSDTVEIGSKTRIGNGLVTAALFQTDTQNEIVVDTNTGGRSSYKNAGETRRRGLEIAVDQRLAYDWQFTLAWTLLDATYRTNACGSTDCRGHDIPGIARNRLWASLGWLPETGWYAGVDAQYMDHIAVNDANSMQAPSWTVAGLYSGYKWEQDGWLLDLSARVDNLFDRDYAGSVIVNEGNGRYFEPAPGRNYGVGATFSYAFR